MEQKIFPDCVVSPAMAQAIGLWSRIYRNASPWLKPGMVESLNLGATIASKLAKLVTVEMDSHVVGGKRAAFLEALYQPVLADMRRYTEYACAKGGLVFKPYPEGNSLGVDVIQAESFFPLSFNSRGRVLAAVFTEQKQEGKTFYTKWETHEPVAGGYRITNRAFMSKDPWGKGQEIPLSRSPWKGLERKALLEGVTEPLFAYFRIPQANPVDPRSPLGVSVFAHAVELMREADKQYSRLLWEYEGGELAIDADRDALRLMEDRWELPKGKERLFRGLDIQGRDGELYQVFAPQLRDESYYQGLNRLLQRIECNCGLSTGSLAEPKYVNRTATEVRETKQDMYATVVDIQRALEVALTELVGAMDVWVSLLHLAPREDYAMTFDFDDSIVADAEGERNRDLADVAAGILNKYEYRMRWYGEDEAVARARCGEEEIRTDAGSKEDLATERDRATGGGDPDRTVSEK